MIQEIVSLWEKNKDKIADSFRNNPFPEYETIVKTVVSYMDDKKIIRMDPDKIEVTGGGDYQGELFFTVGSKGRSKNKYTVEVSYGSCSHCDTLQGIRDNGSWDDEKPNESQVKDLMTFALHIVQAFRII